MCSPRINAVDRIGARQQRCDRSRFSVLLTTRCLDVNEIIFVVEDSPEGGYLARALGVSIYTQADSAEVLHERVRDAVRCHFDADDVPKLIRLHFVRDEVISA